MDKRTIVSSLAMDLRRAAQGLHRGSFASANIFKQEALKRGQELENANPEEYLQKIWLKTKLALEGTQERAEDFLMYSILFQNYTLKKL